MLYHCPGLILSYSALQSAEQEMTCDFLDSIWVGRDTFIREACRSNKTSSRKLSKGSQRVSTISVEGMGNFAITAKELKCLLDNSWLNDEIINSYMALLRLRSKIHEGLNDTSFPRCEFFSSFFSAILRNAKVRWRALIEQR